MTDTLRAGAAVIDITPGVGIAMGGYGARQGVSTGIHDPLQVRTLVLDDGTSRLVLAVCDLLGTPADLVRRSRELVAAECGIPPENVCISATHTHSGPMLWLTDMDDYAAVTARKIAGSVQVALGRLRPVTLKLATADVTTISQNRRHPDGPIETVASVLLAAPEGGGEPVATLVNYACHATVLEWDNLLYSADFPGATARALETAVGGVAIYMQGAAGDINPVWMRHDFEEVGRVGGILSAAAARAVHELRPLGEGQWAVNLSWTESTPKDAAHGAVLGDIGLRGAHTLLDLPRRALPSRDAIEREAAEMEQRIGALTEDDVATRRSLRPRLNQLRTELVRYDRIAATPGATMPAEVQALRIADDCAVVTLPGEFLVETGQELRRRCGVEYLLVCGYANDYLSYVPMAKHFPEAGYEVGCALFAPEAEGMITEAAVALVRSLFDG